MGSILLCDRSGSHANWTHLGTYSSDGQGVRPFLDTKMGSHAPGLFGYINGTPVNPMCKTGKSFHLLNHDSCRLGGHVIVRGSESNFIGSVEEILQRAVLFGDKVDFVLIKVVSLGTTSAHGMPRIEQTTALSIVPLEVGRLLLSLISLFTWHVQNILCTVNVQHDCIKNGCSAERVAPVRQEGELTSELREQIVHRRNPQEIILNTAQMRSARLIQPFHINSILRDTESIVLASVQKEIALQHPQRQSSRATTPSASPRNASLPLSRLNPRSAGTHWSMGTASEYPPFTHIPSRSNVTHAAWLPEADPYPGEAGLSHATGSIPMASSSHSLSGSRMHDYDHPGVSSA